MTCIEKIYSVSALVGDGSCNAKCKFCAGCIHEAESQKSANSYKIRANFDKNLESAIKLCAHYGGWSLSLTSAGEPTMCPDDVTSALEIYAKCARQGACLPNVNLFTNGIRLGDKKFCDAYLRTWKDYGLTNIALSIHSPDRDQQAKAYGLTRDEYPYFSDIIENIKSHGLGVRATLLLNKQYVGTLQKFIDSIEQLTGYYFCRDPYTYYSNIKMIHHCGSGHSDIDNITCWPIVNPDGSRNEFTPSRWELFKIKTWLALNAKKCHGHIWGGSVYDWAGNLIRMTDYVTKHDPKKDYVRQLVVFPSGEVTYSWIREGALCMK